MSTNYNKLMNNLDELKLYTIRDNLSQYIDMINSGEKNAVAKKFNAMSKKDKEANQHLITECEKLEFKMLSVRDILWMRQGHIKIELPYEARKEEEKIEEKKEEKKGLKGFFSRFKR